MLLCDPVRLLIMTNMTILKQLKNIPHSQWYWLVYMFGGIFLIAAALYYQYFRDEQPCTMCIQVRLWITLFIIVSFIGLLSRNGKKINSLAQLSIVLIAGALVERSYQLLGTERGFLFSNCGVDLGFPTWFAIEEWLPWIFRVETSCGYTPEIFFGITMAESLMVMSVILLIVSFCIFLVSFVSMLFKEKIIEMNK